MTPVEIASDALLILVAPAGAGKSTFARRWFRPTEIVSSDACRALVSDDEADQGATGPAYDVFHAIVRGRLTLGRLTVADATNLHPASRARLRGMAAELGRPCVALALDVPLELCQLQNLARPRNVPPEIVAIHYQQYQRARELLAAEGYAAVHVVRPDLPFHFVRVEPSPAPPV